MSAEVTADAVPRAVHWRSADERGEAHAAAIVLRFPDSMTCAGAAAALAVAREELTRAGVEVVGETVGFGSPEKAAVRVVRAFWEPDE